MATNQISLYLKDNTALTPALFYSNILIKSGTIDTSTNEDEKEIDIENLDLEKTPGRGMSNAIVEGVARYMEATVLTFIASGISNLLLIMGINEETMSIAKQAVNIMNNSVTLVSSIIKAVPSNIYMIPSGTSCTDALCTSLKDMFDAMWLDLEELYFTEINNFITNLPSLEEVLKDLIDMAINEALNLIDVYCYKYTGYHIQELYYLVRHYIALYKQYKELKKLYANNGIALDTSISANVNPNVIKQLLLNELNDCSDLIYNAFLIVLIKDTILQVLDIVKLFHDADLTTLADNMNSFSDVMDFLVELGLGNDETSLVLSLEETLKSNINNFQKNALLLIGNIGALMVQSGMNITDSINNSINLNIGYNITQMYEFKADTTNGNMIMYIYSDPTTSKFKKMLNNSLSEKTEDGSQYMDNANILLMFNKLEECYKDDTVEKKIKINNIEYVFHFDIKQDNTISINPKLPDINYPSNSTVSYSLGLVTEEYTEDPLAKRKRPTMQLIHELFVILKKFMPILQILIVLISNYKINKEKVKNHALGNLYGLAKLIASVKGLSKKVNVNNTNFYTVRTLQFYNYLKDNIVNPNNSNLININILQTEIIYVWLKSNNGNYDTINIKLPTLLYIDYTSINKQRQLMLDEIDNLNKYIDDSSLFVQYPDSKYKDGDLNGLDKVEYIGNEVYYSDSSLPIYGSLILIALGLS